MSGHNVAAWYRGCRCAVCDQAHEDWLSYHRCRSQRTTEHVCEACGVKFMGRARSKVCSLNCVGRVRTVRSVGKTRIEIASSGCWAWLGQATDRGYGTVRTNKYPAVYAHRLAWALRHGDIPPGLHIDHLCFNRLCVNPDHLEPVTQAENNRRAARRRMTPGRAA